jgi:SynChlorMet cassette radical SAM/SPASM protein ScmF
MQTGSVPALRRIYLYLSGQCNLACRHCWINPASTGPGHAHLPLEALQRIIDSAGELGLSSVKLTGGEPMLYPQAMELVRWLHARGLAVVMETNGTLIDAAVAGVLREAQAEVAVSLDGPTAEAHEALRGTRGCFGAAVRGVEALRGAGMRFQIVTCLYRGNRNAMQRMPGLARQLGARSLKVNPVVGITRAADMRARGELLNVAEILQTREEVCRQADAEGIRLQFDIPPAFEPIAGLRSWPIQTCGILNILGVLHNGHASMCGIGQVLPELDMGDLTVLDVRRVWREARLLRQLRTNVPDRLGGICGRCMLKRYCLGKCLAHDYLERGEMFCGHAFCREAYEAGLFPQSRLVEPPVLAGQEAT